MAAEANTDTAGASAPLKTPLHARHVALGARMVPFAGYDMPVRSARWASRPNITGRARRPASTSA
jgi:glycine cleavage system aminomethyltransferase T